VTQNEPVGLGQKLVPLLRALGWCDRGAYLKFEGGSGAAQLRWLGRFGVKVTYAIITVEEDVSEHILSAYFVRP
jgi:hypothetical protein